MRREIAQPLPLTFPPKPDQSQVIEEQIDHRRDKPDAEAAVRDARPRPQQKRAQPERTLLPISTSEERGQRIREWR